MYTGYLPEDDGSDPRCEGVIWITHDIIIYGKNDAEHDRRLHKFMKVTWDHGLVLNKKMCKVKFFGYVYNKHRAHPDPLKVIAIKEMSALQRRASALPWNSNISHDSSHNYLLIQQDCWRLMWNTVQMQHIKSYLINWNHWYVRTLYWSISIWWNW